MNTEDDKTALTDGDRVARTIKQAWRAHKRAYMKYNDEEKQAYWARKFIVMLFKDDRWDRKIDVACYRQFEPNFDLFILGIAESLAHATGEDKDDILDGAFILDDTARRHAGRQNPGE